ncbi:MAG: sigma-70 family RNA polymerase sigma factor [Gemmataceae bacterium]|nr:sigma-70 family RNA polymerase sigma factor [Gemmataceae bacterium]MCI0738440.1 sigma-70 family RNA polymerase sigma factor [Gemmataceae bacterium]
MPSEDSLPSSVADMAALGRLFDEHRPRLLAMLERRIDPKLKSRLDAESILQETYFVARRRWNDFRTSTMTAYAWLYRLALDSLIETWRRETRGPRDVRRDLPLPEGTSLQLGLQLVQTGTSPSEALMREELRDRVQKAMSLLSENDRQILWMRHFDDLAHADIAAILELTEAAAQQRYHRALGRLSDLWQSVFD